jgi:hypothetical protein
VNKTNWWGFIKNPQGQQIMCSQYIAFLCHITGLYFSISAGVSIKIVTLASQL